MPPDFQWSAFYFFEIRQALIDHKNRTWEEHTETDAHDPIIRLLDLFALIGHLMAVRLDHVARELFWLTMRLRSSAIGLAQWIDRPLLPASPALVTLVSDLTSGLSASTPIVAAHSIFATDSSAVLFEYNEDAPITSTQTGVFVLIEADAGAYSTPSTPAALWSPTPTAGDALYIGHPELMFDRVALDVDVAASGIVGRWEYYDPDRSERPDAVTDAGGQVRAVITTTFGASVGTDAGGGERALVVLRCDLTGVEEELPVQWDGSVNFILASGTLGQASISTSLADYTVEPEWVELPDVTDESASLTADGDALAVRWTLPQDEGRDWQSVTIGAQSGYYVRFRVVTITAPTSPTVDDPADDEGVTYSVRYQGIQGRRQSEILGTTSIGEPRQTFDLSRKDLLSVVQLTIGGEAWDRKSNLLASSSNAKDYTLKEQPSGVWRVTLGDGTNGKIPSSVANVEIIYRVGGSTSGNVGAGLVTRDRTGNPRIRNTRNPRSGAGWVEQEGITDRSFETIRESVPASLRTRERAVSPEDFEDLSVAFRTADGRQIVARALAVEEGNGPKTTLLRVVSPAGQSPNAADLAELETYFNGELLGVQRIGGVALGNTETSAEGVQLVPVSVVATVQVAAAYASIAEEAIKGKLEAILQPLADRDELFGDDDTDFLWQWGDNGGKVSVSTIQTAITSAVRGVITMTVVSPASDVTLTAGQLPTRGAVPSITVISV